jgi:farnesyl-diphosphate farnesyltransferase
MPSTAAERFCREILPDVSRTFALSVRVLPGDLGRAVLAAYLLCRIADTVEDEPRLPAPEKAALLDQLLEGFAGAEAAAAFVAGTARLTGDPAHVRLVHHADLVFALHRAVPEPSRQRVEHWVREMVVGMRKFVLLYPRGIRIQTIEEYREYCYYVAGTVGYMLTDLWREHAPSIGTRTYEVLRERAREFGEALQTVNILKDVAQDVEHENSIYIPEHALRAQGSSHATLLTPELRQANHEVIRQMVEGARTNLGHALEYLLLIPRRALSIRLFCALPLLFAYATLRELTRTTAMLTPGGTVKITRREVKSLLVLGPAIVWSNRGLRWLVRRVGRRKSGRLAYGA